MKELGWIDLGETYVADVQSGRAIISPIGSSRAWQQFQVRLETPLGALVADETFDFEGCKSWTQANLPLLDLASGKLADCGNVLQTLEMCQRLLSPETDAAYCMYIEHIKKWIAQYTGRTYDITTIPLPEHPPYEFDWRESGNHFYVETLHGWAVIEETRDRMIIGGGIRHIARIEHHSGAVLKLWSFVDFMEAEAELKRHLRELDRPYIDEIQLGNVDFTLDICQRILPEATDPIHYARLDMLGMRIHFALD